MRPFRKHGLALVGVVCVAVALQAEDASVSGGAPKAESGSGEMAAMMAEVMKYASPGEHHRHLDSLAGTWHFSSRFHMAPEALWSESSGECVNEWILGGRFLQQKVKSPPSEAMPVAFEGFGLLGYDNLAKKYINVWTDSFSTGVMLFDGSCDPSGRVITVAGEFESPVKIGTKMRARWVYKVINENKFVFEMWEPDSSGNEYLHGEITYTRVR